MKNMIDLINKAHNSNKDEESEAHGIQEILSEIGNLICDPFLEYITNINKILKEENNDLDEKKKERVFTKILNKIKESGPKE